MKNKKIIILFLIIFSLSLIFRIIDLEKTLLGDEIKWISRSTKFFNSFISGNFKDTFSTAHPGVSLMWASGGSFWLYSKLSGNMEMFREIGKTDHINPVFPEKYIHEVPKILKVMRLPVAILSALLIALMFLFLKKIIGFKLGFLSALLIATDPFIIANSRLVHLDGLLALFMACSVLSLMLYSKEEKKLFLILAGIFTALSLLTKLPSFFLFPFFILTLIIHSSKKYKNANISESIRFIIKNSLMILSITIIFYIILWPAMWVHPIKSLYQKDSIHSVFSNIPYEIETPHKSNFFLGKQTERVGWLFYPVTLLFKTTPLSLILFFVAIILLSFKNSRKRSILIFFLFVVFFTIMMSLGAKKGDRYILPVYPFIDILAAFALYKILKIINFTKKYSFSVAVVIVILLSIYIFSYSPYFIAYFNPLIGGGNKAKEAYVIGLGEGLDLAASYLNQKEEASSLKVASWYSSSFAPFFNGKTFTEREASKKDIDYIVLYINGIQRKLPQDLYEDYFLKKTPETIIKIKNIDYVWIYKK